MRVPWYAGLTFVTISLSVVSYKIRGLFQCLESTVGLCFEVGELYIHFAFLLER